MNELERLVKNQAGFVAARTEIKHFSDPERDHAYLTESPEIRGTLDRLLPLIAPASPGLSLVCIKQRINTYLEPQPYDTYKLRLSMPRENYKAYYPSRSNNEEIKKLDSYSAFYAKKIFEYPSNDGLIEIWPDIDREKRKIIGVLLSLGVRINVSSPKPIGLLDVCGFPLPRDWKPIAQPYLGSRDTGAKISTAEFPQIMEKVITDILKTTKPITIEKEGKILQELKTTRTRYDSQVIYPILKRENLI